MIPNFSPPLSYSRFNDEPTNSGLLSDHGASFSSSRLPSSSSRLFNEREASFLSSLLPSSFSHHEREPADRGWLSDRGASFSSSRLPSSFSRFSDDVSSDDDEHAPPSLFDHDHVPSRFSDDHEHVSSDDDEHAPPSLFDHEHVPSWLHELSLSSDDDEHVPRRFSNGHDHEYLDGSVMVMIMNMYPASSAMITNMNQHTMAREKDASTSANDKLVKNGSFVVGSSQQKQGFDMHNTCPNCRSKLNQQ
ncbi:hypothetical protein SO802_014743 [Lithocarpus litseifolius]|uniref:Uncharacterized protein n=1 Tax=Lithocarpus litseifolius TaxID=425828 RepID=A0AAW2CU06_9ROSI